MSKTDVQNQGLKFDFLLTIHGFKIRYPFW
jgi:hypothetical protein